MTSAQGPCRKGIILAGGTGSRLHPMTVSANKHLLPVFDKPMIFYPLTTLMLAGARELLVITNPEHLAAFTALLGDGSDWGISIKYAAQEQAGGIAEALLIGEDFIAEEPFGLILGDNIFFGHGLPELLSRASEAGRAGGAILTYRVADPRRYGVLITDREDHPQDIIEKPEDPRSNRAVTGLYFYAPDAVDVARRLAPSARGELEITDVNRALLSAGRLSAFEIGRGHAWFDAGTAEALAQASAYVEILQRRQSTGVAFPEEVAYRQRLIDLDRLKALTERMPDSRYRSYLRMIIREEGGA